MPGTIVGQLICTSGPLRTSTRVSSGFALPSIVHHLSGPNVCAHAQENPKLELGRQSRTPRQGSAFGHQWGLLHQPLSCQCHGPYRCLRESACSHCAEVWIPPPQPIPSPPSPGLLLPVSALCLTDLTSATNRYLFLLVYFAGAWMFVYASQST